MLRLLIVLIALAAAALGATWVAERPGSIEIEWLGWQIETTTFFGIIVFTLATISVALVWGVLSWLFDAPRKIARVRKNGRARHGRDLFAQGFLAAEGGDAVTAKKLTEKAGHYLEDNRLMTLLTARSAEAAGDNAAAERAYIGLLNDKKAGLLARRGLADAAARRKDYAGAAEHASVALQMSKSASWAFAKLFEHKLAAGDWKAALVALDEGEARKFIGGKAARRRRAVILSAAAMHAERRGDREEARELAQKAAILAPGFAPAAAALARLYAVNGDLPNAERVVSAAWQAAPHPVLARLFSDLRRNEAPADRSQRMLGLADINPGHRESRIVRVEQRILLGQWDVAQQEMEVLLHDGATSRLCSLMAAVAQGRSDDAEARDWLVLGATAPREPDWSDVDPDGHGFAYTDDDWERLVQVYGDTGQLIHPRYERYLPDALPGASASLLPMPARLGVGNIYAPPMDAVQNHPEEADYTLRLPYAADEDDESDDGVDVAGPADDDDEPKKRSVLSWFSRRG